MEESKPLNNTSNNYNNRKIISVDTNVISELMKPRPSQTVVEWFDNTDPVTVFVSTVTIGEIIYGLNLLPFADWRTAKRIASY